MWCLVCGAFHKDLNRYDRPVRKVCTHSQMKAIGVKITVVTSAAFHVGLFGLKKVKKQKDEQVDGLVVFCQ